MADGDLFLTVALPSIPQDRNAGTTGKLTGGNAGKLNVGRPMSPEGSQSGNFVGGGKA